MMEIFNYIQANYQATALSNVAAHFHLSEPYLSKYIHEKSGKTFGDILINIRLKKAKTLLRNGNIKVLLLSLTMHFASCLICGSLTPKRGFAPGISPAENSLYCVSTYCASISLISSRMNHWLPFRLLRGMLIGYGTAQKGISCEEGIAYLKAFIPCVDNWSVCDSFCHSFTLSLKLLIYVLQSLKILPWFTSFVITFWDFSHSSLHPCQGLRTGKNTYCFE